MTHPSPSHHNHYLSSSPRIDQLFVMSKLGTASSKTQSQNQQIELIRQMGRQIFGQNEELQQQIKKDLDKMQSFNARSVGSSKHILETSNRLYDKAEKSRKLKMEKVLLNQSAETTKFMYGYQQQHRLMMTNRSGYCVESKYLQRPKKQERLVKEVLTRKVKQENAKIQEKNRKQTKKGERSRAKQNVKEDKYQHVRLNRKGTIKEVEQAFQAVVRKGEDILKRKEKNIIKQRLESYDKEMIGVTFRPYFESSQKLRKCDTRQFLQRLSQDQSFRQNSKINLLKYQLSKDSFRPKLNDHKNQTSQSKIVSFRDSKQQLCNTKQQPCNTKQQHWNSKYSTVAHLQMQLSRVLQNNQVHSSKDKLRLNSSASIIVRASSKDFDFLLC